MNLIKMSEKVEADMKSTMQCEGVSVYSHGMQVMDKQLELLNMILKKKPFKNYTLPQCFEKLATFLEKELKHFGTLETLECAMTTYALYHDCGKPYCLEMDGKGSRHFVNHAQVSFETWFKDMACKNISFEHIEMISHIEMIANLIKHDMVLHSCKKIELEQYYNKLSKLEWIILIITGFAEIHTNSIMFGGIESVGFKIKYKKLCGNVEKVLRDVFG